MERDYSEMMNLAVQLEGYSGFLTTEDKKEELQVRGQFKGARNQFVYSLLREAGSADEAIASVSTEIEQLKALQPEWSDILEFVHQEVVARAQSEARKSPILRTTLRWAPIGLGVACLIAYFTVRLVSAVEVSQPIETRIGIQQRAEATEKVLRYDELMSARTRRGGFLKGLVLWPIEPTEAEANAAGEFVAIVGEGLGALASDGRICGGPAPGTETEFSDQELDLVESVAKHVLDEATAWQQPPAMTVLAPIEAAYPCP